MVSAMKMRHLDLRKLNSATKYPSILTYHALGDRGRLREEIQVSFDDDAVLCTEKLDGTNTRITLFPGGDFIIGSREELLHARGDLIHNPALGIVDAARGVALRLSELSVAGGDLMIVFGEVYGGKTTASKGLRYQCRISCLRRGSDGRSRVRGAAGPEH
jgi:hypothetical protein